MTQAWFASWTIAYGRLSAESRWLVKKLQIGRREGAITPTNPVKGKDLALEYTLSTLDAAATNIEVCRWAIEARKAGIPVANDGEGYFLAWTPDEIERTIRREKSRMRESAEVIDGLERAFRDTRQQELFEGEARA